MCEFEQVVRKIDTHTHTHTHTHTDNQHKTHTHKNEKPTKVVRREGARTRGCASCGRLSDCARPLALSLFFEPRKEEDDSEEAEEAGTAAYALLPREPPCCSLSLRRAGEERLFATPRTEEEEEGRTAAAGSPSDATVCTGALPPCCVLCVWALACWCRSSGCAAEYAFCVVLPPLTPSSRVAPASRALPPLLVPRLSL
jgi:hypothetical protein